MLNSLHSDIKFTAECSDKQLPVLDVLVKKLKTDIYYKPTDSKQYLLFNSCHFKHTRTSIPYSLARRIRSIVTNEDTLQVRLNELSLAFKHQNYPVNVIVKGIDKAMKLRKQELRIVREKPDNDIITYVSKFNPKNSELFNSIRENLPILQEDETMNKMLQEFQIIKSKRQPRNLKKLITRAKFCDIHESPNIKKCNKSNYGLCEHLLLRINVLSSVGKHLKQNTPCHAR